VRILAIDHGDRRFGLAISDVTGMIARPLEVVEGEDFALRRVDEILDEDGVERIVLGFPLDMDGGEGTKAQVVKEFKKRLEARVEIPVRLWDERLTTVQAERILRDSGLSTAKRRARVDMIAAQIILQSYLDSSRASS